jgi:3-hydroxyisobutyrate dehydrogenase-like beta-hydroxyacid dehydrogenase
MNVGFIGLGSMGQAIAGNVLRAGHRVRVWNRTAKSAEPLVRAGAELAREPAGVLEQADVLMTMLADDDAERAVLLGQGVLEQAPPKLVHVNLATISASFARELAAAHSARGIAYVAAPVFGRPEVAQKAKLNVVVAGAAEAVERVRPLLEAIGERLWSVGTQPEKANVVKLAGNFMIASALETMGEAVALTRAYGVEAADFLPILTSSLFAAPVYQVYGRLISEQRFEPAGFYLRLGFKDVRLALQAAEAVHAPLPFASVLHDHFLEAIAAGEADRDWAAIAELAQRRAGLVRRGDH